MIQMLAANGMLHIGGRTALLKPDGAGSTDFVIRVKMVEMTDYYKVRSKRHLALVESEKYCEPALLTKPAEIIGLQPKDGSELCTVLACSHGSDGTCDHISWSFHPLERPVHQLCTFLSGQNGEKGGSTSSIASVTYVQNPDDHRTYMSFWGRIDAQGGCCHASYSDGAAWDQAFELAVAPASRANCNGATESTYCTLHG